MLSKAILAVAGVALSFSSALAMDHPVKWSIPPSTMSVSAAPGDTVTFNFDSGHNVYQMPDSTSLMNCDFQANGAKELGDMGPVTFMVPADAANGMMWYFSCEVTGHCMKGMKLTVMVGTAGGGMNGGGMTGGGMMNDTMTPSKTPSSGGMTPSAMTPTTKKPTSGAENVFLSSFLALFAVTVAFMAKFY